MNEAFREATTGLSFNLNLSRKMCLAILIEHKEPNIKYRLNIGTYRCLQDRGLVRWGKDEKGRTMFLGLTQEGVLVANLLERAGMTIENLTPSSMKE
jgi:hypothetical protein